MCRHRLGTHDFGISFNICFGRMTCRYSNLSSESGFVSMCTPGRRLSLTSIRVYDPEQPSSASPPYSRGVGPWIKSPTSLIAPRACWLALRASLPGLQCWSLVRDLRVSGFTSSWSCLARLLLRRLLGRYTCLMILLEQMCAFRRLILRMVVAIDRYVKIENCDSDAREGVKDASL